MTFGQNRYCDSLIFVYSAISGTNINGEPFSEYSALPSLTAALAAAPLQKRQHRCIQNMINAAADRDGAALFDQTLSWAPDAISSENIFQTVGDRTDAELGGNMAGWQSPNYARCCFRCH